MDTKIKLQRAAFTSQQLQSAESANKREHELTLWQAVQIYKKAICWSALMSTALVMDGYDFKLIGSLFAQPAFAETFGIKQSSGKYEVPAKWQSALNNGSNAGQMLGLLLAGLIVERVGFRKTMLSALAVVPCIVLIQIFADELFQLEVGQILLGIPLGMFQTITTVYASEVTPVCLRAYLTSYVSGCWLIGQLIAAVVLRYTLHMVAPWAYRVPFALQLLWPVPLLFGAISTPDSPWWLIRQNRVDEAKTSLLRLTSVEEDSTFNVEENIALIILTTEHERETTAGASYVSCFQGTDLRRTLIVMGCYCITVLSGSTIRAYATYFFLEAGLPMEASFDLSIVLYMLGVLGLLGTWLVMPHVPRQTFFLAGQLTMTVILFLVGLFGLAQRSPAARPELAWGVGALLALSSFVANVAISPVLYALVSELPSSLLRSKSVTVARFSYTVLNVMANILTPYQLNSSAWNWGALSGFFWAAASLLGCLFTYLFVPEPKGRTVAELDLLFARKVPARQFSTAFVQVEELAGKEV